MQAVPWNSSLLAYNARAAGLSDRVASDRLLLASFSKRFSLATMSRVRFIVFLVLTLASLIAARVAPERRQVSPIPTGTTTTTLQWTVTAISDKASGTTLMAVIASPATTPAWPPPAVTVTVNTEVHITLVNSMPATPTELSEKVTLHFHGLLMNDGFVSMDGPEGITQWQVATQQLSRPETDEYNAQRRPKQQCDLLLQIRCKQARDILDSQPRSRPVPEGAPNPVRRHE